jgi:hypothetical protein
MKLEFMKNYKLERLENGETFIKRKEGNSMNPLIKSGQEHRLAYLGRVNVGDIVYCKSEVIIIHI